VSAPDDPTRRLAPAPAHRHASVYVETTDEALWRQEVRDRLRSQATAIALVGVLAVAGLAVGLWAVLSGTADDDGASSARVQRLEQRVDRVEAALRQRAAALEDVGALGDRQRTLEQRIQGLEQDVAEPAEQLDAVTQAIAGTQQAVEQLEQRVDQLEQTAP
jgi:uncharacterized coiled-coil protein SlyX